MHSPQNREWAARGVGAVEGLILNKLLLVVTAPTELYLVVRFFQARRARIQDADPATPPPPTDGTGVNNRDIDAWDLSTIAAMTSEELSAKGKSLAAAMSAKPLAALKRLATGKSPLAGTTAAVEVEVEVDEAEGRSHEAGGTRRSGDEAAATGRLSVSAGIGIEK